MKALLTNPAQKVTGRILCDARLLGLLGYWAIGLLGYWAIGLLGYIMIIAEIAEEWLWRRFHIHH